jgi:hypothetical protein
MMAVRTLSAYEVICEIVVDVVVKEEVGEVSQPAGEGDARGSPRACWHGYEYCDDDLVSLRSSP